MKFLALFCLVFVRQQCLAINIDDINLSNCTIGSPCEDSTINDSSIDQSIEVTTKKSNDEEFNSHDNASNADTDFTIVQTTQTTEKPILTTAITITSTTARNDDAQRKIDHLAKNHSDVCTCDIKISSCDINCCCDIDCNEFQLSVFSHCDNHHSRMYDSRYCYTKNFIQRNNTQFILDRLASNLFCIAYDNLPPIYGMSEVPELRNRQDFEKAKYSTNPKRYTWEWHETLSIPSNFNFSSHYHDKTAVWKFHENFVKLMELPQSGLTGECTFGKIIKYLETSRWSCMQTNLSNDNSYLFVKNYNDFAVISSPHLFNSSYATSMNHSCPSNVCLKPRTLYCASSWKSCVTKKSLEQSCNNTGKCHNAIKQIRYTILHNGTNGIKSIEVSFVLANVSQEFYQHFEIIHEWIESADAMRSKNFLRSGNPGYTYEKPIIIGKIVSNMSNDVNTLKQQVNVNSWNYHLTLPLRGKDGNCMDNDRYIIGFGENIRMRCNIEVRTKNFSSISTCMNLQNKTLRQMLDTTFFDVTRLEEDKVYISKIGDLTSSNDLTKWTKILFEKIPRNVITGQLVDDKIRCSAIVTSMKIEILHTISSNHENAVDNHVIAGVALTFGEPIDIMWNKCLKKNCTDIINVELTSYVTFTDISTSSMYYYAGGPNLDISLPYDFFYPFMSGANRINEKFGLLLVITLILAEF